MKRILSLLLSIAMVLGLVLVPASAVSGDGNSAADELDVVADAAGNLLSEDADFKGVFCEGEHELEDREARRPTYNSVGWEAHKACKNCLYTTKVEIPKLEVPAIEDYDTFLMYLSLLEELAYVYVQDNPGKDPLDLVVKYVRTGVDRYNSGSWNIMAGYEDASFAKFVAEMEDMINLDPEMPEDQMLAICSLKNLKNFKLPNGDIADVGHIFGTLDISQHNNFSVNHADVAGWAGDLVDLLEFADVSGVDGTLEEMIGNVSENYLGHTPADPEQSAFTFTDISGDLDGYYIIQMLQSTDYEMGVLTGILSEYFSDTLTEDQRAAYFLRNRLDGASTRSEVRDAVYTAYISNKVVATLEGTRVFQSENLEDLKKACCYSFADYLCELAGDYVEEPEVSYFEVFDSKTSILAPGVKQEIKKATTKDGKQTVFYVATADINRDDVNVYANYHENDPSLGWAVSRVLDQANAAQEKHSDPNNTEDYIPNYSVVASTNGAGFNMSTGEPGGLLVMNGKEWHPINGNGFFGILKDGTAVIGTTEEYNTIYKDQVQEGIAGFGATLVADGKIVVPDSDTYYDDRASRTAVGITKTGKVVLMVMDGRQEPASCGGSMQEIAQVMLEAGCYTAINLDGGGSTTYVAKPEGKEELELINVPSDGVQRSVSASLMIVSTAPDSKAFDHALVDSAVDYMTLGASVQMTASGVSATGNPAEIPEGAVWKVSDERWATITETGMLTALRLGSVDVSLVLDEQVIGSKTIEIVTPQNLYFTKTNIDAVYGSQVELPIKVLYNNKEVAITENDVTFSLSNSAAGSINGVTFTSNENTGIKNVQVNAKLISEDGSDRLATITVSLYNQGEMTFDFDQATGGTRMLAWDRQVSNATTEDEIIYTVENSAEDMVISYTLALDMTQIPIPERLEDLTYMLPGADMEGASAWTFLCGLAERISVLTEVHPVVQFDADLDVDYSNLKIVNDYFALDSTAFDKETNTLRLTLRWKDQTQAIDPTEANPLCIVSGIKLTPKDDAQWGDQNRLQIVNSGDISYYICMRASALYTFACNEENQETFGLYPYENPEDSSDRGGSFSSTYTTFEDSYTLVNKLKSGWILQENGFAYYVDGVKLTGVQAVDGIYYNFGTDGINVGKTPYTGIFTSDEKTYYAQTGKLVTSGYSQVEDKIYHFHSDGTAHEAEFKTTLDCTHGGQSQYYCNTCKKWEYVGSYIFPTGHDWDVNHTCLVCGTVGKNIADAAKSFGTIANPVKNPEYFYQSGGVRPPFYVSYDGTNALTYSNDNNLINGKMRDLYISWTNDKGIGKATMSIVGRGDYYGETTLEYKIVPNDVVLQATATHNSITLTWNAAAGADYYKLYWYDKATQNRTLINGKVTGTSYTVTTDRYGQKLTADTEYYFIMRSAAVSTDGENTEYTRLSKYLTAKTAEMPSSSGLVTNAAMTAGNSEVTMLTLDGSAYFFLPADADLSDLKLRLTLAEEMAGENVVVSGDLDQVSATASGRTCDLTLNLSQLTSKDANDSYTIGIATGDYPPMTLIILQSKEIPSLFITSDDSAEGRAYVDASKTNETTAQMTLTEADGTVLYDDALSQIKARGNSTFAHYDKKSYQIKLAQKSDLIKQGEDVKTWVLLANYGDATLMHDKFFKDLAADMEMPYVAGCNWVNLWYDGEYRGVYLLSEKNSVGSTAVDITDMEEAYEELNVAYGNEMTVAQGINAYGNSYAYTEGLTDPANITGGYLIELNHSAWDEVNGFKTSKGKGFNVKSPEWASDDAMQYISEYYQAFENAVYATDANGSYTGYNAATGKYFYDYVDMDSLVKVFLLQELGLNPDGFISSLYFYKDVDGLMYAGPIWDQDMTLGTGWTKYIDSSIVDYHYLAEALIQIPVFKARVSEYFQEEFAPMIEAALAEDGIVDSYYVLLADNAELNYLLWPYIRVGDPANANHVWQNAAYDGVVADMKAWMSARMALMEETLIQQFVPGDANNDGKADSSDAVAILRSLAGYEDPGFNEEAADFNGDGKADSSDAVAILRKLAGY